MKFFSAISLLLLVSCGDDKNMSTAKNRVGEIKELTTLVVAGTELSQFGSVCRALQSLEQNLGDSVNSSHLYDHMQTDCSGNVISSGEVNTVLVQNGLNYTFKRASDGVDFIFPNVETSTNGVFSEICTNLNSLSSPVGTTTQKTYFTTIGISPSDCPPSSGEICVKIEKATVQGLSAVVQTKDFLRVRISNATNSKIGFVTQRKKVTRSFCGTNEVLVFTASLK